MTKVIVCETKEAVEKSLAEAKRGKEVLIVIAPPEEFGLPQYHVVCATEKLRHDFLNWIQMMYWRGETVVVRDVSDTQTLAPRGLTVLTVIPADKSTFPEPKEWMKES